MAIERADNTGIMWASPWCPDRLTSLKSDSLYIARYGYRNGQPGFRQLMFYRGKLCGRQEWRNLIDNDQLHRCVEREPAMSPDNPEKWDPANDGYERVRS